jgi:hypothetical protein
MARLTELSSKTHKSLNIVNNAAVRFAAKQHVMALQATEIPQAATCFPVFISRNSTNGQLSISALTSFIPNRNVYVRNDIWEPVFKPSRIQTHPLYLMQSPEDEKRFTIGFDTESGEVSSEAGTPLFTEEGKASESLMEITRLLHNELKLIGQSFTFLKTIEELQLLKAVDMPVQFESGQVDVIQGFYTIDEDRLQTLSTEQFETLRKSGYLMPIHALLISMLQVNALINRHNTLSDVPKINGVKIETRKDTH